MAKEPKEHENKKKHAHHKLTHKEEVKGGKDSHMNADHHHKQIKHHMAALHKMAKHAHKSHAKAK